MAPLTVRGARVLEVAPGTGQNSLFLARLAPESLTLVEPNPVAIRDIASVYATPGIAPVPPLVIEARFEEYEPDDLFDIVVCENWLGSSEHELRLLQRLGRTVADGGLLLVTSISPVGMLPNLLRRALAHKLTPPCESFADRTTILCRAFGPHLHTLEAMTRCVTDWVQDNMLNPAYFGILLTVPMVLAELSSKFDFSVPVPLRGRLALVQRVVRPIAALTTTSWPNTRGYPQFFRSPLRAPGSRSARNAEFEAAALSVCKAIRQWEAGKVEPEAVDSSVRRVIGGIRLPSVVRRTRRIPRRFRRSAADTRDRSRHASFGPTFWPRNCLPQPGKRPDASFGTESRQPRGPTQSAKR